MTAPLVSGLGTARRLRALAADGWPPDLLRRWLPGFAVEALWHADRALVTADLAAAVADLYQQLGVGPDRDLAGAARALGWPPGLAWEGQSIDTAGARPAGQRTRGCAA